VSGTHLEHASAFAEAWLRAFGYYPAPEVHDTRKTRVIARRPKGNEAIQSGFRIKRPGLLRYARNDGNLQMR
jgi:hypothetical protein